MNPYITQMLNKQIDTVSKRNAETIEQIQTYRKTANELESALLKDENLVRDLQDLVELYEKS